jgi:transcriptional regulator with XRE-family HTH domain
MKLNRRISQSREALGLSQSEVGRHFNISRAAVAQWEQESGTAPDGKKLPELAKLLKVDLLWLLTGTAAGEEWSEAQRAAMDIAAELTPANLEAWLKFGRSLVADSESAKGGAPAKRPGPPFSGRRRAV